MKLIIQIPCFNEELTLPETFHDLPKEITGIDIIEYLIIDDGSTDNTIEVAKKLGINHIIRHPQNMGLAKGFMTGIDACLRLGADIIVNTDGDNQYRGADIEKLVQPILNGKAAIVVGDRQIDTIEEFSPLKKKFQKLGSGVVRKASRSAVTDTTSGFRAYSRNAAMRLFVVNEYTYTLETIIEAGHRREAILNVLVRTNRKTRESRLFKSMWGYMRKSASIIIRTYTMYKSFQFFFTWAAFFLIFGVILGGRYLYFMAIGEGRGHIQSLILTAILIVMGVQFIAIGLLADGISATRKINDELLYRVKKIEYDGIQLKDGVK